MRKEYYKEFTKPEEPEKRKEKRKEGKERERGRKERAREREREEGKNEENLNCEDNGHPRSPCLWVDQAVPDNVELFLDSEWTLDVELTPA